MSLAGAGTLAVAVRPAGDRSRLAGLVLVGLCAALAVAALLSVASGPTGFMPLRAIAVMASPAAAADDASWARDALVILEIRLPARCLGILIGAALAVAGCVMQGLFRNPLADPGLVGTSSGAALAAVTVIVLGGPVTAMLPDWARPFALPAAAFAGALASTALLYAIATRDGRTSIGTMLLAGIALAALAARRRRPARLREHRPAAARADLLEPRQPRRRDLGEGRRGLALHPRRALRFRLAARAISTRSCSGKPRRATSACRSRRSSASPCWRSPAPSARPWQSPAPSASSASSCRICLRLVIGPTHRALIPASALLGAILLLAADMASRTIVAPAELPIGILTALFGAPFFLWLLLSRRSLVDI